MIPTDLTSLTAFVAVAEEKSFLGEHTPVYSIAATRRVQNLVEERRSLEGKTARLNRLSGYLPVYFPQLG
jgi:hypothetical protein